MTDQNIQPDDLSGGVVVGVDGSANAEHALAWAVAKAEQLGPILPIMTFTTPTSVTSIGLALSTDPAMFRQAAETRLAEIVDSVDPSLAPNSRVIEGHTGVALCKAAEKAKLLVVGTRGTGALMGSLTGSTSIYCAKHSVVPVVIVPENFPSDRPLSNVVVGLDGSENAEAALRWAIANMEPTGRIAAVGAFPPWGYINGNFDPPREVMEAHVRKRVEDSVARVVGTADNGPDIEIHVATRDAREALRRLAGLKVDMLVVGSRGESGLSFLFLGSVATALAHHPKVPTVIVPGSERKKE
jgi:nucleotide-binding universal stress UspA family protein